MRIRHCFAELSRCQSAAFVVAMVNRALLGILKWAGLTCEWMVGHDTIRVAGLLAAISEI
jgi:hypothetical protein